MKQLSNQRIKNIFKKSFSLTLILILLITNVSPLQVYAETPTPTPSASNAASAPSDPTLQIVSDLSVPQVDATDQNPIQPSFEPIGPPSPQLAFTPEMFVLGLSKENFQVKEQIELTVKYSENEDVSVSVIGADASAPVNIDEEKVNGDTVFTLEPSAELKPGKYTVKVIDNTTSEVISEQDFTWGVLAINTNKSIYLPGEKANIAIAVLDEAGQMVCDAHVQLEVTNPLGEKTSLSIGNGIFVNPECLLHEVTVNPDYQTAYTTSSTGRYLMTLTAITPNGSYTTKDRFEVRDSVPFDVERITATRIYPPEKYPVKMKIHANEDFVGKIIESVPAAFQISQLEEPGVYGFAEESPILANLQYEKDYGIPDLHLPFNGTFPVSQGFGEQIDDPEHRDAYKKSGLDGHDGIDFALPEGTPIVAVDDGQIILAKENWIYGTSIVIQHSWGRTYYGHLSKLSVAEGENVTKGMQIGLSGSTGLSTGPHLHFGLKPNDNDIYNLYFGKIDPSKYLGIASEDPVLTVSEYPAATKAIIWNVKIAKGADFVIGYQYLAPPKSPDFYTIGPLQFVSSQKLSEKQAKFDVNINPFVLGTATPSAAVQTDIATVQGPPANTKDRVIFQEIRPWQLAIDVSTTVILDANSDGTCGSGCWTVPNDWTSTNRIYSIGGGGAGDNTSTTVGVGGGGGGAFASISNNATLTPGNNVTFNVGSAGTDGVNGGNSWLCNNTASCANYTDTNVIVSAQGGTTATSATGGAGGTTAGVGTIEFAGGAGGSGQNTGDESSGGGGGAGSPYGTGGTGAAGDGTSPNAEPGGGGGGAGCDSIGASNDGSVAVTDSGGNGGASCFASGAIGTTGFGAAGTLGSGGAGSGGSLLIAGNGGDGRADLDPSIAGGGGGGGDDDTDGVTNWGTGGTGGSYGGGGGGGNIVGNGGSGIIVITYTLTGPSLLSQLMRHGAWFNGSGVEQTFTF